jgi:hypothetical protein
MNTSQRRRALLLLACLAPLARAGAHLAPALADRPVDLIRHVLDEVLISPRQRAERA